jgi:RNA polymerase sigma-70 factor (ECF subfamily)
MPLDAYIDLEDDALLAQYSKGDAAAARALTTRLTPRIYGYAVRMLADRAEAEDVTQDAMMRLWKIAPDWRVGEAKVSTWLYRVTANLCTDRLRRKRGLGLDDVDEPHDPSPSVTAQLQTRERMDALQTALHMEGLANPEIAQILEISTEAVESLTARGKRALAQALAPARAKLGYDDDSI